MIIKTDGADSLEIAKRADNRCPYTHTHVPGYNRVFYLYVHGILYTHTYSKVKQGIGAVRVREDLSVLSPYGGCAVCVRI